MLEEDLGVQNYLKALQNCIRENDVRESNIKDNTVLTYELEKDSVPKGFKVFLVAFGPLYDLLNFETYKLIDAKLLKIYLPAYATPN